MGEIKVSVILPSLNVYKYIRECIESVINQTLKEIEIICVDAGSTDGTLEILREYETKDSRIKVILSDKKSYGYQMNLGMDNAAGEYIGIVETDDFVLPDMYEELYKIAVENDLDFVKSDFYRFTGGGCSLSKAYNKLTGDVSAYNHVYDIRHNQIAFRFLMNTWCGIYNREFLKKNQIRHNETPGASYQDNGFWFQTFMYSDRAWFLNKAFYMNRRDNAGSSVYNTGKVYCICDEYVFLYKILKNDQSLMDNYGFAYTCACFYAYKGNLERIADEFKEEFLLKFSEDFKRFRDENLIDFDRFEPADRQTILEIIDDPCLYYHNKLEKVRILYDELRSYENIIIYGAGLIGRRVLNDLTYCNEPARVLCFAVSKLEDNFDSFKGVPIRLINDLLEYSENSIVVIATTYVYQEEIASNLARLGFKNVVAFPDQISKDEKYFKRLSISERKIELNNWVYQITGRNIEFNCPVTFNDYQHAQKIKDISELKRKVSDLVYMRQWAGNRIGQQYMPPVVGVFDDVNDIHWDGLPDAFIIKLSHGRSYRTTVEDKNNPEQFNKKVIIRRLKAIMGNDYSLMASMELWYEGIIPRVVIESPLEGTFYHDSLKFICFNGNVKYVVSDKNNDVWSTLKRDIYDEKWRHLDIKMKYPNSSDTEDKPIHLAEMIRLSEQLGSEFDFCIVHFWETKDGPVFNKIRFIIGGGVEQIIPDTLKTY